MTNNATCPQCGLETEQLHEGYCEECCRQNQEALDRHNAEYDHWLQKMRRKESPPLQCSVWCSDTGFNVVVFGTL